MTVLGQILMWLAVVGNVWMMVRWYLITGKDKAKVDRMLKEIDQTLHDAQRVREEAQWLKNQALMQRWNYQPNNSARTRS